MKFITVQQYDRELNEIITHFLQWTGNERELVNLWRIIEDSADAYDCTSENCSDFQCKIIFVSEKTVDEMIKIDYGLDTCTFEKHTGRFVAPHVAYKNDAKLAHTVLNECYHKDGFKNAFVKNN